LDLRYDFRLRAGDEKRGDCAQFNLDLPDRISVYGCKPKVIID